MAAGYVDTNGVRLWYQQLGRADGAAVLLVMGGGASVVWWPPELLGGLVGAGYRVIQFDNRDTGLSSHVDPVETDADIAELEVEFCRAVVGSRFAFDEQHYRDIVAADLARGMNPAANAPAASSRIDQLARIRVPTLVVHGTEDPVYPFDHAEVLAAGIPEATLVRWEGVGHEQPPPLVPELTRLVIQHLDAAS
jgi:pimeloyl-ACP methyl ester carboxylesterase